MVDGRRKNGTGCMLENGGCCYQYGKTRYEQFFFHWLYAVSCIIMIFTGVTGYERGLRLCNHLLDYFRQG